MEPASGFPEVKSDNCCALDHSMPLYLVLLTKLGQMLVCFSPSYGRNTCIYVEIIVVMEIARLCALVATIAITTDVIEHPCNNPIISSRRSGSVVPFSCWIPGV